MTNKEQMRKIMTTIKGGEWPKWYAGLSDEDKILHNKITDELHVEFQKRFDEANKTYTIYLKDIDPDTGNVTQTKELATTKTKELAETLVQLLHRSEQSGWEQWHVGGDPNRDYYYK